MKKPLFSLCIILAVKAALIIYFIHSGVIGLGPDEAQYWTWSQKLDWGYYSKPPAIAWQIWLGTEIFGNTELGVRFMAIIIGSLLPLAVYFLARACRLKKTTAFWAGIVMALSPLGIMSSILATTDGGMVLFWTLSCIVIANALSGGKAPNYYLLGTFILCGALFKWPIFILWIFVLLAMVAFPEIRSIHVVGGVGVSLLGLLPSIFWNYSHDWATFQHVLTTIIGGHGKEIGASPLPKGNLLEFIGAQASLLSPIIFVLMVISLVSMIKNISKVWSPLIFCGGITLILLIVYSILAIFQKMQGNWCVFAYPSGIVLLCWFACERASRGRIWLKWGVALSIILTVMVLSIPFIQSHELVNLPYKINPFRHNLGWKNLESELQDVGYDPNEHFLFGDKYQMTSILSFYSPGQKRSYFLNLHGARKNQFSYWPGMAEEQKGKTGYFVLAENEPHLTGSFEEKIEFYNTHLKEYFGHIELLGIRPLFYMGSSLMKGAIIYKCFNYNGKEPQESELY